MRLTENRKTKLRHFRNVETESDYIGTKTELKDIGEVSAVVQSAENRLNAEIYGKKVSEMLALFFDANCVVLNGDIIAFEGKKYCVVSLKKYRFHKVALVEAVK